MADVSAVALSLLDTLFILIKYFSHYFISHKLNILSVLYLWNFIDRLVQEVGELGQIHQIHAGNIL